MKHIHGSPGGGTRKDQAQFWPGRDALVPFPRQDDLGIIAAVCRSMVFDNGAWSVKQRGETLDVEGFTRWTEEWSRHPIFEWSLIPDVIDGTEADNDAMIRDWPRTLPGVPVWHLNEDIGRLERLCRAWHTVALGSSGQWRHPGTTAWWQRMAEAMDVICDEHGRPMAKLHGLRMLDPAIFTKLPLSSADSTNAAVNGGAFDRFGMYRPYTAGQGMNLIADRIEAHPSAPIWTRQPIQDDIFGQEAA